jgi:hypothetical protein
MSDRASTGLPRACSGEAEIEQLRATFGDDDVGRLQVTVQDASAVGRFERTRDLSRQRQRLPRGHRPGAMLALQSLDRHRSIQPRVARLPHLSHPAFAKQREDLVWPDAPAWCEGRPPDFIVPDSTYT